MKTIIKNKIFILWVLILLSFYFFHLNYHFKGKIQVLNNKNSLLYNISQNKYIKGTNLLKNDKWKIILFAHPECPCTKASITELKNLSKKYNFEPLIIFSDLNIDLYNNLNNNLNNNQNKITSNINFSYNITNEYISNKILAKNLKIKQFIDYKNSIIVKNKLRTSGYTILFDESNNVVYSGGITPYRGHTGSSELHKYLDNLSSKGLINGLEKGNSSSYEKSNNIINFSSLLSLEGIKDLSKLIENKNMQLKNKFKFKNTYHSEVFGCALY